MAGTENGRHTITMECSAAHATLRLLVGLAWPGNFSLDRVWTATSTNAALLIAWACTVVRPSACRHLHSHSGPPPVTTRDVVGYKHAAPFRTPVRRGNWKEERCEHGDIRGREEIEEHTGHTQRPHAESLLFHSTVAT